MVITYFGGGTYRLQSGETSLLVDPENNRLKADVVLKTLASADFDPSGKEQNGSTQLTASEISFPGEYEVKGIEIFGLGAKDESGEKLLKTVYAVEWEEMKFVFLGHVSKPLPADIVEEIEEPDVLFLPVGGGHFLAPEVAAKIAKQLEPSLIFPTFYKSPADFLKAMGQKVSAEEKFVFKKKDLANEKNKVVILETRS
ncbi:MAG: MBL fold metallo-hydrolase [Candidatus Liptonbacteria bacterium]|nr:MBL fold metallo-hydrolase [Candidatus Liptonbacteria bacterium]